MNRQDIERIIKSRASEDFIDLKKVSIDDDADLSNLDLHRIDFTDAIGERINFGHLIFIANMITTHIELMMTPSFISFL